MVQRACVLVPVVADRGRDRDGVMPCQTCERKQMTRRRDIARAESRFANLLD